MSAFRIFSLMFLMVLFAGSIAHANSIRETRPLNFGTIALTGAFPQDITIATTGAENHSAGLIPLRGFSNGVFEITGLDPNTNFNVIINDTIVEGGAGVIYDVVDFTFSPDTGGVEAVADGTHTAQADGLGNLSMKIGATLQIRNGTSYDPGAYRGTYQLVLNF